MLRRLNQTIAFAALLILTAFVLFSNIAIACTPARELMHVKRILLVMPLYQPPPYMTPHHVSSAVEALMRKDLKVSPPLVGADGQSPPASRVGNVVTIHIRVLVRHCDADVQVGAIAFDYETASMLAPDRTMGRFQGSIHILRYCRPKTSKPSDVDELAIAINQVLQVEYTKRH